MKYNLHLNSDIIYIILIDEYKEQLPFLPPTNISKRSLDIIKFLPKNFLQLFSPETYFNIISNSNDNFPYKVFFVRRLNHKYLLTYIKSNNNYQVIIYDKRRDLHLKEIIEGEVNSSKKILHFFDISEESSLNEQLEFFFDEIIINKLEIFKKLHIEIEENVEIELNTNFNEEFDYFMPNKNNFLNYKTHLGQFSVSIQNTDEEKTKKISDEVIKKPKEEFRLNSQLEISRNIDNLYLKHIKPPRYLPYFFEFPPLLISIPFNNPDILDFFKNPNSELKKKLNTIRIEQNKNFLNVVTISDKDNELEKRMEFSSGAMFIKEKLHFLDSICFLNASFKFSPYLRFPIMGKSLYRELSFISPNNFNKFLTQKAQFKLSDTILKIGNDISQKLFSKEIEKYIKNRNSQIIAISDLPFEWTTIDSIPICFTHDITRIPETTYSQLLNTFASNVIFDFTVDETILQNTLVIIGNDDPEFNKWQTMIKELSIKKGFNFEQCLTIKSLTKSISKYKPKFLIIDTHGGFDESTKETFLWIGKEKLTNDIILQSDIAAPLVFISACGTSPVYGTFQTIANTFLYKGSKAVTSTFLPIEIDSSTSIYMTILNNLDIVAKKGSFNNWLEYISYSIRSSFIHRTFYPFDDNVLINENENLYHSLVQDIMIFKNRSRIYNSILEIQRKKSNISKKIKSQSFEFLYYTNIGRGDLVLFENYRKYNGKINFS